MADCSKLKKGSKAHKSCIAKRNRMGKVKSASAKLAKLSGARPGLSKTGKPEVKFGGAGSIDLPLGKGWGVTGSYRKKPKFMGKGTGFGGGDYDYNIKLTKELGPRKKKRRS